MHFFLLLVPFVIILGIIVFITGIFGFAAGLISYFLKRDLELLTAVWIIFTILAGVGLLMFLGNV